MHREHGKRGCRGSKMKRLCLLTFCLLAILLSAIPIHADTSPTSTIYSSSTDGTLYYTDILYPVAHDASSGSVDAGSTTIRIGQTGTSDEAMQSFTYGENNQFNTTSVNLTAQSFTVATTHIISTVWLKLFRVGNASTIGTVSVYIETTDVYSRPSGVALCNSSLDSAYITDSAPGDYIIFDMGDGYTLVAGGIYTIVLAVPSGDASNYISWRYNSAGNYTGGSASRSYDNGNTWSLYASLDCMFTEFATYGTIWRGALPFTISLPASANITSAQLGLYATTIYDTAGMNLTIVSGASVNVPLQSSDYWALGQSITSLGSVDVTSLVTGYNYISLNTAGLSALNPNGTTVLGLRTSRDISFNMPVGDEYIDIYSSEKGYGYQPVLIVTYTIPALGTPTNFAVSYPSVFTGYTETGDQLYVFRTSVYYPFTPDQTPQSSFSIQLLTGTTVVAQTPLTMWGYKPGSIYLSPDEALVWGGTYTVKIVSLSNSSIFTSLNLTSAAWKGSDLALLDSWVEYTTAWMELSDGVTIGTYHTVTGSQWQLSEQAGAWFIKGVPALNYVRHGLFIVAGASVPSAPSTTGSYASGLFGNWGSYWTGIFDDLGDSVGLGGQWIASLIFLGLAVVVVALVRSRVNESPVSMVAALPILAIGVLFGVPIYLAAIAGIIAFGLMIWNLIAARV